MSAARPEPGAPRPYTLVAELTYRCPLRCVYCSNPLDYAERRSELDTATWLRVLREAEALGVVQLHLTGGEPLLHPGLTQLLSCARELGLYTNLITSAVGLTRERLVSLRTHGLDHIQISIQGVSETEAERFGGKRQLAHKLEAARWARDLGVPLTLNVVLHRDNIAQTAALVELAERIGADRIELANTQYLGWALHNRAALLPSREQIDHARTAAQAARERLGGKMEVLFVLPDYYAGLPRACMDGWGRRYVVVNPEGLALPCHLAHTIDGMQFESVVRRPLAEIWQHSIGMNAFRGEGWMPEPCRSCERRTLDFGGCRCQAFHLAGNAALTDPACQLAPHHSLLRAARAAVRTHPPLAQLHYRGPRRAPSARD